MQSALVTGATGFIGRRLCELLRIDGWTVTGCGRKEIDGPWHKFFSLDLCEDQQIVFPGEIKHVLHLAGKAHALDELRQDPSSYRLCNADGTRKVLEAAIAARAKSFTLFSSTKAMGEGNADYSTEDPINETFPCLPQTAYGRSKLEAEKIAQQPSNSIRVNTIRPCLVYGPKSKGNLTRMAEAVLNNRFPPIPELGNKRSVVHVDDLCRLAMSIVNNPKIHDQTFIAAEPIPHSTREIQNIIRHALGKTPTKTRLPVTAFRMAGLLGDLIGKARGRRFIFDSQAFLKLQENAYYDGSKACSVLDFKYKNALAKSASCLVES